MYRVQILTLIKFSSRVESLHEIFYKVQYWCRVCVLLVNVDMLFFFNWNYDEKYFVLKKKFYRKNVFIDIIFKSILLHIDSSKISKTHTNFYPQKKTFHKQKLQYKQTSSAPLNLDITSPDTIPKRTI